MRQNKIIDTFLRRSTAHKIDSPTFSCVAKKPHFFFLTPFSPLVLSAASVMRHCQFLSRNTLGRLF